MECQENNGGHVDAGPETRLWQAVILSAVQDWIAGPARDRQKAEAYLFRDEVDFPRVCQSAGMDASRLRTRLKRLREGGESPAGVFGQ